jgi:hypothetical protein
MLLAVSALLTIAGAASTYVAIGMTRAQERRRCYQECERQLELLRRQLRRLRPK